jgi:acetyl-CoA carboxylase biotin carboxylase subunit
LNVKTVAVYSKADANSMHVQVADEAICIGDGPSTDSYLRIDRIISAAEIADVDAIHPGYGFLSENAHFADVCESCNIRFIGPRSAAMNALHDKASSRNLARRAGVPTPPGSEGLVETEQDALAVARKIGYPVMIKAVAGGGGRGMRAAHNDVAMVKGYHTARSEAEKAFGNSGVYIEKFIENPHHIEFQILGDNKGNIVHLGERDCSIQRRNQKLIEETPSPMLEKKEFKGLRARMGRAALGIAKLAGYTSAGTVEFIVDDSGSFYFLEVNKRIQVEHPITEEVTGVDIVKQQILVALGEKLSLGDVEFHGHAIECRINAENPFDDFRPSPGRIEMYYAPGGSGIRVDSHAYAGYTIPPYYDSMIAKLITYGKDRADAMNKMIRALSEYMVTGVKTTIPFEQAILQDPDFRRGTYTTSFIERLVNSAKVELIQDKA